MGIKPQVVKAAIAAMRPEVSCDFSERPRSPQRVRPLADKIDIAVFYFTEQTCGQGGSAAPLRAVGCSLRAGSSALEAEPEARAMLIQLSFADTFNIEVEPDWLYCSIHPGGPLLCRDLRHEREKCSVTLMLHAVGRDKAQRRRIDRVTLSGGRC